MYDKLDFIQSKYEELSLKVSDPAIIADQAVWQRYAKEIGEMEPIVQKYAEYKKVVEGIREAKEILSDNSADNDMRELAKMELSDLEGEDEKISEELKILLLPKDPNDQKNVILRNQGGNRRRRGGALRGGSPAHVYEICRAPRMENRDDGYQ